jgi:hypothetical protein
VLKGCGDAGVPQKSKSLCGHWVFLDRPQVAGKEHLSTLEKVTRSSGKLPASGAE